MEICVSRATVCDVPGLVDCALQSAREAGPDWAARFDQAHAERHMSRLVIDGHCFVAKRNGAVIGLIACMPIDVGYARIADLETAHIYVRAEERASKAVFKLFEGVEAYAADNGLKVLFHQADYPSAIDGRRCNGDRVETLFRRRRYDGPIDIVYSAPDFTRVGITYLFDAAKRSAVEGTRAPSSRPASCGQQPPGEEHHSEDCKDRSRQDHKPVGVEGIQRGPVEKRAHNAADGIDNAEGGVGDNEIGAVEAIPDHGECEPIDGARRTCADEEEAEKEHRRGERIGDGKSADRCGAGARHQR